MRPLHLVLLLSLTGLLLACSDHNGPETPSAPQPAQVASSTADDVDAGNGLSDASVQALDRYQVLGEELVAMLSDEPLADAAPVHRQAESMVALAIGILPDFLRLQPHCQDYLEAARGLVATWRSMDVDAIETGYHKDQALPSVDNGASCYHMKDLIVHPISARALLNAGIDNREPARREIQEVLAHLGVVRATRP